MNRAELVDHIRATRREFEALLGDLNPRQMMQPGVREKSVKDILAHIAWYEGEEADFYGEINVEGSPLWKVPQESRNEILFEHNRHRALEEVLADFRQAHERLLNVIERYRRKICNTGRSPAPLSSRACEGSRFTRMITTASTST